MAKNVINEKGFKIIALNSKECEEIGFGFQYFKNGNRCWELVCDNCNSYIADEDMVYYIPVLNKVFDKGCLKDWYATATYYPEDARYESLKYDTISNYIKVAEDDINFNDL